MPSRQEVINKRRELERKHPTKSPGQIEAMTKMALGMLKRTRKNPRKRDVPAVTKRLLGYDPKKVKYDGTSFIPVSIAWPNGVTEILEANDYRFSPGENFWYRKDRSGPIKEVIIEAGRRSGIRALITLRDGSSAMGPDVPATVAGATRLMQGVDVFVGPRHTGEY